MKEITYLRIFTQKEVKIGEGADRFTDLGREAIVQPDGLISLLKEIGVSAENQEVGRGDQGVWASAWRLKGAK